MPVCRGPDVDEASAALVSGVDVALVDAAGLEDERQRALAKDLRDAGVVLGIHLFGREQRGLVGGEVVRVDRNRQDPVSRAAGVVDPHPDRLDAELGQRHAEMAGHLLVRGDDELHGHAILGLRLDASKVKRDGLLVGCSGRGGKSENVGLVTQPASNAAVSNIVATPAARLGELVCTRIYRL